MLFVYLLLLLSFYCHPFQSSKAPLRCSLPKRRRCIFFRIIKILFKGGTAAFSVCFGSGWCVAVLHMQVSCRAKKHNRENKNAISVKERHGKG